MKIKKATLVVLHVLILSALAMPLKTFAAEADRLQAAKNLYLAGEVKDAITAFLEIPESEEASYGLVRAYLNQNEIEKAVAEAEKLYKKDSSSGIALTAMGDIEYRLGHFESASLYYKLAVSSGRKFARSYLGIGKVLKSERMMKSSKACIERAFQLDPGDPDIVREQAFYMKTSPEENALWRRYLETALYKGPSSLAHTKSWLERREAWSDKKLRHLKDTPVHTRVKLLHIEHYQVYTEYGIKVKINGNKTAKLTLDTGASGIFLKKKFADSARISLYGSTIVGGLGNEGDKESRVGLADTVEIGDLVFENYPVNFFGKDVTLSGDGLIGTDVFEKFHITLDFKKKTMFLDLLPPPPGVEKGESYSLYDYNWQPGSNRKFYTPFRLIGPGIIVSALMEYKDNEETAQVLLDTGAERNIVSDKIAHQLVHTKYTPNKFSGVSGEIDGVEKVHRISITCSGVKQISHRTYSFNLDSVSESFGTEISGLLGYPFIKNCTLLIDYRTAMVRIIPDPYRFVH